MTNITLRLIFVNYDGKPTEISVPVRMLIFISFSCFQNSWNYKELKKHVLSESWPSNYIERDQIERLRLFSGGKELEDGKSVSGMLIPRNACMRCRTHIFGEFGGIRSRSCDSG